MDNFSTMSITEARKRIFELTRELAQRDAVFTLTERGKPVAVLMSEKMFSSWKKTVYMMQRYPGVVEDIDQSVQDMKLAQYMALEDVLNMEGYLVSDNAKQQYDASRPADKDSKN